MGLISVTFLARVHACVSTPHCQHLSRMRHIYVQVFLDMFGKSCSFLSLPFSDPIGELRWKTLDFVPYLACLKKVSKIQICFSRRDSADPATTTIPPYWAPPPEKGGISVILARYHMKTRQKGAIPPLRYYLERVLRDMEGHLALDR